MGSKKWRTCYYSNFQTVSPDPKLNGAMLGNVKNMFRSVTIHYSASSGYYMDTT